MLPPRLQELWDGMEEHRNITLGMISGLSEQDFVDRREGEWSVAQILEHLVLAETGTSKVIRKTLKENAGRLPAYPADDSVISAGELAPSRGKMTEAPEVALPRGSRGKEEILRLALQAREATRVSLEMLAGADPRSAEFPHPFLGSMNLYEWPYRIILEHEKQHHAQIEKILRRLGK